MFEHLLLDQELVSFRYIKVQFHVGITVELIVNPRSVFTDRSAKEILFEGYSRF